MAIEVKLKTNQKLVSKNYKRLATKLPRFIEQGLKQAGFHLLDIIRTKTLKKLSEVFKIKKQLTVIRVWR